MKENNAIVDLLAEGLVKQDELNRKVDRLADSVNRLAEGMEGFRVILQGQTSILQTLVTKVDETGGDVRDMRYWLNKEGGYSREIADLKRRVSDLEDKQ